MTMRFLPNQYTSDLLDIIWYWFNFMRTASPGGPGWTVPRSSNGLVGGVGDNISTSYSTGRTDLNRYSASTQRSWFVLRAPGGAPEFLLYKVDGTSGRYQWTVSPSGSYTGGDAWNTPTASDSTGIHSDSPGSSAGSAHIGADDASPYGWYVMVNQVGSVSARWCSAFIPMDVAAVTGDPNPWSFFYDGGGGGFLQAPLTTEFYGSDEPHCYAMHPSGTGSIQFCTTMYLRNEQDQFVPNYVEVLPSGEDVGVPVTFGRRMALGSGFYKGVSSFMQWNGRSRAVGEMFAGKTRVSVGVVNVPWDGASAFLLS